MLENLYQQIIQLAKRLHPSVVRLHKLLDRQLVAILHTPERGELFLMVKQQPIIGAPRHGMESESDLAQEFLTVAQLVSLALAEKIRVVER